MRKIKKEKAIWKGKISRNAGKRCSRPARGSKGFLLSLFQMVFIIVVVVALGVLLTVGMKLGAKITKNLIIDVIYQPVSTQDALLSLLEMKDGNGITFNKALVYATYEETLNPQFYQKNVLYTVDMPSVAKKYLDYVYSGKKYWLFLYDDTKTSGKRILTLAREGKDEDFNRAPYGSRDSIPIKPENYWLVLYVAD
jgi:hypothetical protein